VKELIMSNRQTVEATTPSKAPFLMTKNGGYYHRDMPEEDGYITHVGPGTPAGEYLRRFWHPVAYESELTDVPLALTILGEELVVYRDRGGRVGCLELHCPHRGTSLEFGILEERGIRCCYHGWLFDADGTILETPGEPVGSTLKDRLFHGAYPVRLYKQLVFVYMGPPDKVPGFPEYDTFDLPGYEMKPRGIKYVLPCNWLQVKDNSMDPVHTAFLHTLVSGAQFTDAYQDVGSMEWQLSPIGMVYIHTRRKGDMVWVHMNDFIPPNIHQFPPTWEDATEEKRFQRPMATTWHVPIDDTHTLQIGFMRWPKDADPAKVQRSDMSFGQTGERTYEERQRKPGDFDAQVGQRPIAVHGLEHLGTTDRGVIQLRKLIRDGIDAVQRGEDPLGVLTQDTKGIPTYSQDSVMRIPRKPTEDADLELLRQTGHEVAEDGFMNHPTKAHG
jgi:phenylpropionate dioxygenase-like ring-hydroxylating dioxygenase large terminal subunit